MWFQESGHALVNGSSLSNASGISRYGYVLMGPVSSLRMEELLIGYHFSRDFRSCASPARDQNQGVSI